jgi:hypothetical protein
MEQEKTFVRAHDVAEYGSCLRGFVELRYTALVTLFGEPERYEDTGGDGKVSTSWWIKCEQTDDLLEIHDWKCTSLYDDGLPPPEDFRMLPLYDWRIGGTSSEPLAAFQRFLRAKLGDRGIVVRKSPW